MGLRFTYPKVICRVLGDFVFPILRNDPARVIPGKHPCATPEHFNAESFEQWQVHISPIRLVR